MVEVAKITSSPTSPASSGTANLQTDYNQSKSDQPTKKGRNRPGMPDPDAEVIALSPKSLLATNRFVCEICNKGFQRDQNLQLHRRGHNLPWRLRQRTSTEVRKRVYVCPEPNCVHHEPSRALGDLTGIKKHFSRKHGEKKFKCQKCEKKYAVQSDWKAHMKTCGTKEYRCDCGTLFSRRDSFITHRAFCDALAQESARSSQPLMTIIPASSGDKAKPPVVAPPEATLSPPPPPLTPSTGVVSPVLSIQSSAELLQENQTTQIPLPPPHATLPALSTSITTTTVIITTSTKATTTAITSASSSSNTDDLSRSNSIFTNVLDPSEHLQNPETCMIDPISLSLSSSLYATSSLLQQSPQRQHQHYISGPQPALSATALLQKAAQIGATSSSSFLRGLGVSVSSSSLIPCQENNASTMTSVSNANWSGTAKLESNSSMASGVELGLPCSGSSSGFGEFLMGQSGMFGDKPATLDFLGLGSNEAFLSSINGELDLSNAEFSGGETWDDDSSEAKQSML